MTIPNTDPLVSIVIRCFNEERHIGKLLHGVFSQQEVSFEVILVDSGSTDDTLRIASNFPVRIVTIDSREFTFGRALNRGCAAARGRFLVFASAHVYPVRMDWFTTLIRPFDNPTIGAVYGKQRGGEGTKFSERRIFEQWFPEHDIPVQDTPFCNNANCAILRHLWELYPYNEQITGLEDLLWAQRIAKKGYRVSYASQAEVIHLHNETLTQTFNRYRREAIALKAAFPKQKMSFLTFTSLFARNVVSDYLNAVRKEQLLDHLADIPVFRLMQFWGAFTGFQQEGEVSEKLKHTFYYPNANSSVDRDSKSEVPNERLINYSKLTDQRQLHRGAIEREMSKKEKTEWNLPGARPQMWYSISTKEISTPPQS
jgi:glycosyltransferase involved in cell wall biosynthesis